MLGGLGEYRIVRHIGGTWRMADWRMDQVSTQPPKPAGVKHWEFMNVERDRAPWLPPLEKRPLNPRIGLTEKGKKILESKPEHIQEIYRD